MTRPKPISDRYRRITPALVVDGASRAIEFYAEILGTTERTRVPGPGGTVAHAELVLGDSILIVEDPSPFTGTEAPAPVGLDGSPAFLYVYVEDVDATMARAVELGARQVRAPENQFYGERDGYLIDPFGHSWTVASHVEDVTPEEMMRRMAAMESRV